MAKKSRRVKTSKRGVRLSAAQMVRPGMDGNGAGRADAVSVFSEEGVAGLREEYGYVATDLKQLGLITLAVLAASVIAAVFLI